MDRLLGDTHGWHAAAALPLTRYERTDDATALRSARFHQAIQADHADR
ncbi:hypothetical protein [Streptomyces niphimycinicus]|nr:hypothetical protein [Streptomyces niphimycinicus]